MFLTSTFIPRPGTLITLRYTSKIICFYIKYNIIRCIYSYIKTIIDRIIFNYFPCNLAGQTIVWSCVSSRPGHIIVIQIYIVFEYYVRVSANIFYGETYKLEDCFSVTHEAFPMKMFSHTRIF